jgi:hypothetical protein
MCATDLLRTAKPGVVQGALEDVCSKVVLT